MTVSARSYLTAGVAALAATAVVIAPVQPSAPAPVTAAAVRLSAAVQPLVNPVAAAAAVLGSTDIVATPPKASTTASPRAAAQANNSASNAIDAVYGVARYWANYFALELGPWLLGFVPFGYLISDQIYIWYPTFTLPVVDSFVYDFLDPVVNNPLNPAVWAAGLSAIGATASSGLTTAISQEITYLVSLQWLPFPIPPLPPLPFAAATASAKAAAAATGTGTETETSAEPQSATPAVASGTGHSARQRAVKPAEPSQDVPTADAVTTSDVRAAAQTQEQTQDSPVTPTSAQKRAKDAGSGAAGGDAKPARDTAKPTRSTAGSARGHAQKAGSGASD